MSILPDMHLKVVMNLYPVMLAHVTFSMRGLHVSIKLGLGHPITFLAMSVNMEFAAAPMKYVSSIRRDGPIHAGI